MTTPVINPITPPVAPTAPKAADSIWTKENNPGVPKGHTESDSYNSSDEQDPAAMNLKPEVKEAAIAMANKTKALIAAGGAAVVAAIALVKRKSIPALGKFFEDLRPITTPDKLKDYAKYVTEHVNPTVKPIKIHFNPIVEEGKVDPIDNDKVIEVIKHVKQIAEDLMTSTENTGKKPVVHIILKPEHADKTKMILDHLNLGTPIGIPLKDVIQKIEMSEKTVSKNYEKWIGQNSPLINVGPPKYTDTKTNIFDLFINYLNKTLPG